MNLAILHYHLDRGGVTRVIENQLLALDAVLDPRRPWNVLLVHGGRQDGWCDTFPLRLKSIRLALAVVPALEYDRIRPASPPSTDLLADELASTLARSGFTHRNTVIHVHNHAVGKNVAMPGAVTSLAELGYPLLLQIHDFAEDLRPVNFRRLAECLSGGTADSAWHGRLYPQAPQVHYAVINGRDRQILKSAGTDPQRLHLLPNPVDMPDSLPSRSLARRKLADQFAVDPKQRFLLYPVRGIRRKNVGEMLLYSCMARPETAIGVALPPASASAKPIYDHWRETARRLNLPCRFDVAVPGALSFAENLAAADLMITTSIAEGFGMVFLEAWLAQHALVGRDLPEITADFVAAGLRLDLLQPRLEVPVSWIGGDALREQLAATYLRTLAAYARPAPNDIAEAVAARIGDGRIDFGDLDEPLQQRILEMICADRACRQEVCGLNPQITHALGLSRDQAAEQVRSNARAVKTGFALSPCGRRLERLYRRVADSSARSAQRPEPIPEPNLILDWFLDFRRFRMMRS